MKVQTRIREAIADMLAEKMISPDVEPHVQHLLANECPIDSSLIKTLFYDMKDITSLVEYRLPEYEFTFTDPMERFLEACIFIDVNTLLCDGLSSDSEGNIEVSHLYVHRLLTSVNVSAE